MNVKSLSSIPPWDWPEDADTVILETLADPNAPKKTRLLAAELGGEFTILSDRVAEALLAVVGSEAEPAELRARAAISLGPGLEEVDWTEFDDLDEPQLSQPLFEKIQSALRQLYSDAEVPKEVRRAVLEASVRYPMDWHAEAVRAAYAFDDEEWRLTAVFCMRYVKGFEEEIIEALESEDDDIHYQAVCAAGEWEIDAAWRHIARLVSSEGTEKELLLAAIDAAASIRPDEAHGLLGDLLDSDDPEVAEAANDAISCADRAEDLDDEDEE